MGGSSGGGYSGRRHRSVQQGLSDADINRCLRELLREYNEQEREAINRHLDVLRDSLELKDDDVIRFVLARIHRWTRTEGVRTQEGGVRKLQTRWPGLEFG